MTENRPVSQVTWGTPYPLDASLTHADLLDEVIDELALQIEGLRQCPWVTSIQRIYLVGCGDSYFAAMAARMMFERHIGVHTEPVESLEFSRYLVDFMPDESLVVAISNGGAVSRTIEAARLARVKGAVTIALTGDPESPLARASDHVLVQKAAKHLAAAEDAAGLPTGLPYGVGLPGLGNFAASSAALALFALGLARTRGRIDEPSHAGGIRAVRDLAGSIRATAQQNVERVQNLADRYRDTDTFFVVGGGPSYAAALFIAAKIIEQPHLNGVAQELEEWAHLQFFLSRPGKTVVIIVAPPGRSHDRALEQMRGARDVGADLVVLCAENDGTAIELGSIYLPVTAGPLEELTPVPYVVPGMMLATALHARFGRPPFSEPFTETRMMGINFRQIFGSKTRIELAGD